MNKTDIEWCDMTWNPVTGCLNGCEYCYARKQVKRFSGRAIIKGPTECFENFDPYYENVFWENKTLHILDEPEEYLCKNDKIIKAPYPFGFDPTFHRYRLGEPQEVKTPQNVFVGSMCDLFGEWVPDEWIKEVFKACEAAPQHRYLFLTKNPGRYMNFIKSEKLPIKYPPNYWYGETTTISELRGLPKPYNHFISIEPIMGNVFMSPITNIKWVIIGAETGNRKGRVIPKAEWIENIVRQCMTSKIPVFMKNSLIPIIGEENMLREYPWEVTI